MKYIETFFSLLIITFWISMNALLISREAELEKVGQFKGGIQGYLAGANLRESWMAIRSKGKRIGYSGYTVEKLYINTGNPRIRRRSAEMAESLLDKLPASEFTLRAGYRAVTKYRELR